MRDLSVSTSLYVTRLQINNLFKKLILLLISIWKGKLPYCVQTVTNKLFWFQCLEKKEWVLLGPSTSILSGARKVFLNRLLHSIVTSQLPGHYPCYSSELYLLAKVGDGKGGGRCWISIAADTAWDVWAEKCQSHIWFQLSAKVHPKKQWVKA